MSWERKDARCEAEGVSLVELASVKGAHLATNPEIILRFTPLYTQAIKLALTSVDSFESDMHVFGIWQETRVFLHTGRLGAGIQTQNLRTMRQWFELALMPKRIMYDSIL